MTKQSGRLSVEAVTPIEMGGYRVRFSEVVPMPITLFVDSNVWDIFFQEGIDLNKEFPSDQFRLCITKEAEFEISSMPDHLREYVKSYVDTGRIRTDSYFGFYNTSLPPDQQRFSGFGNANDPRAGGRFIADSEAAFLSSEHRWIRSPKRPTGLFKNEADVSLAARSLHYGVLTCDGKKVLKKVKKKYAGRVIDLKRRAQDTSLADFVIAELRSRDTV